MIVKGYPPILKILSYVLLILVAVFSIIAYLMGRFDFEFFTSMFSLLTLSFILYLIDKKLPPSFP